MSALTDHVNFCRAVRLPESASPGPPGGPERLRWLIRRIGDDDHGAFSELFDQCAFLVSRRLGHQVPERHQVAGVLAATFVEVWWLAGCHVDPDTDVMMWIDEISRRRAAESRPTTSPGPGLLGAPWAPGVEVELAGLLRRRHPPPLGMRRTTAGLSGRRSC
ncbi:hypothetical protein ACIBSW_11760 [Actinoplanes sp. NPDC049668]|uniref:hypothetical protein n=1 Tax=unclassified Actinoplanes TaxID=2626549 RepID=UPI0033BBC843